MLRNLKTAVKALPVVGPALASLRRIDKGYFVDSADYWDKRYRQGGTSGAGSYHRLAEFKAEFINSFVAAKKINSIIEFGSGDGAQLKLSSYPEYIGIDVSWTAVDLCRTIFANDPTKSFLHTSEVDSRTRADLSLSLDVIYHLVEDDVYDGYMRNLFDSAQQYVIIYASNRNFWDVPHVRHRRFVTWVRKNRPNWRLSSKTRNRYPFNPKDPDNTSFADFFVFQKG